MKVAPLNIRLRDEFEKKRLETLAGENTVTDYVLGRAFDVKRAKGDDKDYPGWAVVERNRRDMGIKISHDRHGVVVLYPEDDAYGQFAE